METIVPNPKNIAKLYVCVAPGCKHNSVDSNDVQFHSFPSTRVGKLWQATLGTVASPSSSMAAVCSKHFSDEDYYIKRYRERGVVKIVKSLRPEAIPSVFSSDSPKVNTKTRHGYKALKEDAAPYANTSFKRRDDQALCLLTQKFVEMLKSSPHGLLDLNQAVEELKTSKTRLHDISKILEGACLLIMKSKRWVQWLYPQSREMNDQLQSLTDQENKLDEMISYTMQQIHDMHENIGNTKYAYLTYEDIQNIPIFADQSVFFIKAPTETILEVSHPKKAFQMHIVSKKGPVDVLGCTDRVDVTESKRPKPGFDGDYSNLPLLRRSTTAAASSNDNANHNTKSSNLANCPSKPTQHTSPKPSSAPLSHEVQNSSPPILPLSISIKEEMTEVIISSDGAGNETHGLPGHESDQLSSDVHMTDLS